MSLNSNSKTLKLAVISDIHLGHRKNRSSKIINNFEDAIFNDPSNSELDIIFLAGDIFDSLLDLNSPDLDDIDFWICRLLRFCNTHDIVLRVLEGTPSHDWTQPERFITLAKIMKLKNLDIDYIDNVAIEYIEKFDINILYVPDEIQPTTEKTLALVKNALLNKGLDKVDFAIMHGQFEYQLPEHIKNIPRHNSKDYLDIVKHYIFIGHIHTHSVKDRIIAQGSFDRLKHGEEEPKGYVKAFINKDNKEYFFIENKNARTYKTIDCSKLDLEDSFNLIKKIANGLKADSCVRVSALSKHPILTNMEELIRLYPTMVWTKHIKKDKTKEELDKVIAEEEILYVPVTISKDNLLDLIRPRLESNFSDTNILLTCESLIKEYL